MIAIVLNPAAPQMGSRAASAGSARIIAGLAFFVGLYALLLALGLSGWTRSRRLGLITTWTAATAAAVSTWAVVSF